MTAQPSRYVPTRDVLQVCSCPTQDTNALSSSYRFLRALLHILGRPPLVIPVAVAGAVVVNLSPPCPVVAVVVSSQYLK